MECKIVKGVGSYSLGITTLSDKVLTGTVRNEDYVIFRSEKGVHIANISHGKNGTSAEDKTAMYGFRWVESWISKDATALINHFGVERLQNLPIISLPSDAIVNVVDLTSTSQG